MSKKLERELHGPGLGEVLLGAALSLVLGAVLGAASLIFKPVAKVLELPKDAAPGTVYYIEGMSNAAPSVAAAKEKSLLEGGAVDLNEGELNALLGKNEPAPKPAAKGKEAAAKPEPPAEKMLTVGAPNFRVHDGVMQVGLPLRVSALGLDEQVIVQARGGFQKEGGGFVFVPNEFYVGSCPVQRLPGVSGQLLKRLVALTAPPAELATAWGRVAEATIEGSTLHLATQ